MNPQYEYIKEASPFGSLRQIPERLDIKQIAVSLNGYPIYPAINRQNGGFSFTVEKTGWIEVKYLDATDYSKLPCYSLSVQPSEEWMQRKEYEEGVDFEKQILCPICKIPMQHNQSSHCAWLECPVCNSGARLAETDTLPCVAIPIEKKGDDLSLTSTNNNSIE